MHHISEKNRKKTYIRIILLYESMFGTNKNYTIYPKKHISETHISGAQCSSFHQSDTSIVISKDEAAIVLFKFGILNMLDVDESRALIKLKMDVEMQWNDTRIIAENPECNGAVANSEWDKIYRQ